MTKYDKMKICYFFFLLIIKVNQCIRSQSIWWSTHQKGLIILPLAVFSLWVGWFSRITQKLLDIGGMGDLVRKFRHMEKVGILWVYNLCGPKQQSGFIKCNIILCDVIKSISGVFYSMNLVFFCTVYYVICVAIF